MQPSSTPESNQEASPVWTQKGGSMLLSLSTLPVVVGILALKNVSQFWQEVGRESEEIFRGDRLPLLTEPPQTQSPSNP